VPRRRSIVSSALRQVVRGDGLWGRSYPYSIPAIASLDTIDVGRVTFFVGENGSGKSTLVEAIAVRAGLNAEGGSRNLSFATRPTHSDLHQALELSWERRPTFAFFLRAETFYNAATAYEGVGIGGFHERSHGESFIDAVTSQVLPGSFVVMDEPEAALSVTGQLKLMRLIHDRVADGSQFLIATHSPILLAFPDARIYELGETIERVAYEDATPVQLTKDFLDAPTRFLRHLFAD